jgi:hypothetical protein
VFEAMLKLHQRGAASRGVCVDVDGAMLGPNTVLVERVGTVFRCASREAMHKIQNVVLSASGNPDWLFEQGQRIADALGRGEVALAQIYGLRIPVRQLDDRQLRQLSAIANLVKTGFNPDEPRIPAGEPGGGEWTDGADDGTEPQANGTSPGTPLIEARLQTDDADTEATASSANPRTDGTDASTGGLEAHLIEAGYNLSPDLLAIMRALYRIYVTPGSTLTSLQDYLAENGLNFDELPSVIKSLFDAPKPLADLQTDKPPAGFLTEAQLKAYLGDPPPGYEWHHIIEQNGQWRPDLTSPDGIQNWIQNTDNMVMVPVIKHYCINGIMSRSAGKGSSLRVRDVLKIHNPPFQREVGLGLLNFCGAIQ